MRRLSIDIEEWRDVPGYEGLYLISDAGRIWCVRLGRALTPKKSAHGYRSVDLSKNGVKRRFYIHRLVARAFLPDPGPERQEINHRDLDKANNRAVNLEWVTHAENQRHAYKNGRTDFRRALRADNKTGIAGVVSRGGGYQVCIGHNGVRRCLGTYESLEEARAVRAEAEKELMADEAS